MSTTAQSMGRRERNKHEKLDRITAAARALFAERGVDEVTTQQIADRADIGTGTLFLYAKTKGELLLLVQNAGYREALAAGRDAADRLSDPVEAIMAIVRPIVTCNRSHIENGRIYLREMAFGDAGEPHHAEALAISAETELAIAQLWARDEQVDDQDASARARIVSAILFVAMASAAADDAVDEIVAAIRTQVTLLAPR